MAVTIYRDINVEVSWTDNIYCKCEYSPLCSSKGLATNNFESLTPIFYRFHNVLPSMNYDNLVILESTMSHLKCISYCFEIVTHLAKWIGYSLYNYWPIMNKSTMNNMIKYVLGKSIRINVNTDKLQKTQMDKLPLIISNLDLIKHSFGGRMYFKTISD